jgi:hypothetical protein
MTWLISTLQLDKHYPEAQRQLAAGQQDPDTYQDHYQSSLCAVDGQATFLGQERRDIVSEAFLELTIPYNPCLSARLPAEQRYKFEQSKEYRDIISEIQSASDAKERVKQERKRNTLLQTELTNWQRKQPFRPSDQPEHHHTIFNRCRFMPVQDRLAANLFKPAKLRSPLGLSVLKDMMALLRQTTEIEFRPGLEPDRCTCFLEAKKSSVVKWKCKRPKTKQKFGEEANVYDWRHIYDCYKQA